MPGRKRTRRTSQKTTASRSLDGSLPKDDRRTGNKFKKERNETYESNQLLSRKQFINESLGQFQSVLSGLAARCNFGVLEDCILKDVFIVNMNNREAQNELCRSLKTPEEVYRIALAYERGNKYATSYVATGSLGTQGSSSGGGIQIKSEPIGPIRGEYRNNRERGRGSYQGRGSNRGENWFQNNRCYNCDQPNFTRENLDRCPEKELRVIFVIKLDITNVPVEGSAEISEDGEQSE